MSAPTKKTTKPTRKAPKRYELVSFQLDFVEGDITVPSFKQVPLGVQRKAMAGDMNKLVDFFQEHSPDVVELFDSLDQEESSDFTDAWAKASGVNLGK